MPLFVCDKCGVVDNTALTNYWGARFDAKKNGSEFKPLCSACDPHLTGRWHGRFPRKTLTKWGYVQLKDGFVGSPKWEK